MSAPNMTYSTSAMWSVGEPPVTYSATAPIGTNAAPIYPYPTPPTTNDMSGYHELLPQLNQPPPVKPGGAPLAIKTGKIKRSISTPNVRGQASADAASAAEKRRNKLGYHRTSVACGHCRRRKIRCIPSTDEHESRCTNCIRLKKECQFYPVEQEPPPQEIKRCDSRAQSSGNASTLPSPITPASQILDMQPPVFYAQIGMPTVQEMNEPQIKCQRTDSFSPEDGGAGPTRAFTYDAHSQTNWMAPKASPIPGVPTDFPDYLSVTQESPITPGFSPFTPTLPQHSMAWSVHPETASREDTGWSVPQRSISYSNLEGLHNPSPYSPYSAPQNVRPQPGVRSRVGNIQMYPPPISTSSALHLAADMHSASTTSASQPSTLSGSISSASSYGSWQAPYGYPKQLGPATESYAPWSSPPSAPSQRADTGLGIVTDRNFSEPDPNYYPHPPPQTD